LAGTGANVVRVFVSLILDSTTDSYSSDLSDLDSVVSSGSQLGFKVVIVFQPITTQATPEFWADAQLQASIAANWLSVATEYNGNATIAGYDLINEPIAPAGQVQWIALATQLIDIIRDVDSSHVIIFEPSPGGIPESFSTMTAPLPFSNIVYSVHDYEPYQFTHQGILFPTSLTYPGAGSANVAPTDRATLSSQLAPVRQFVATFHVPIYVGEFSAPRWAPDLSSNSYVSDSIALFEAEGYSWTYHQWRGYPGWDAELPESFFYQFPYINGMPQGWASVVTANYRSENADTFQVLTQIFKSNAH
jgi:aryl-phospho-beta-D-glucosidase BglC (GH1 family)